MFGNWFKSSPTKKPDAAATAQANLLAASHAESPSQPQNPSPTHPASGETTTCRATVPLPGTLNRFLLRQPVLDSGQNTLGFEFAFRYHQDAVIPEPEPESDRLLADETLISTLIQLEIRSLTGHQRTFVGICPASLGGSWISMLPPNEMVLAIDGSNISSAEAIANQCRERIEQGFTIAFDNLVECAGCDELVGLARYLRFDLHRYDAQELAQRLENLLQNKSLLLIAKQIGSEDDYLAARALGFHAYQGYFFARMNPKLPNRIDNDRMHVMEVLNMTARHTELPELEKAIKHDVLLSYKLLAYINCPLNGLSRKMESIAQALMYLGYDPLYRWLTLLLFTDGEQSPRDRALLQNALVRAHLAETLGKTLLTPNDADNLFIVGIFSLLDVLFNMPMTQAIECLSLPEPVTRALLQQRGPYAPFLRLTIAFEQADQQQIRELVDNLGLEGKIINQLHLDAINWASSLDQIEA